jgi:PPOX class probable F420-dependent enzyme
MSLPALVPELIANNAFAVLTTLFADGRPHSHMMWIDADDECLLINTETGRLKYKHLRADPRCSLVVFAPSDPYRFIDVQGTAVEFVTGPSARTHIDEVAQRYRGTPYGRPVATERVIIRIRADRLNERGPTG